MSPAAHGSSREPVAGTVTSFDASEGLGVLRLDDGREVSFHATQLVDGSRRVGIGQRVTAVVVPWHRGALEATALTDA